MTLRGGRSVFHAFLLILVCLKSTLRRSHKNEGNTFLAAGSSVPWLWHAKTAAGPFIKISIKEKKNYDHR